MKSGHWVRTVKRGALASLRTSLRIRTDRGREAGFTLLEMVCVMAIVAMLAAILLPLAPRGTSHPRLEAYAVEVATLLKTDRNAAMLLRAGVSAQIDAHGRLVRSGAGGHIVHLPDDVAFDALLPERCNGRPALSTISFFANGMSCGGVIRLLRFGSGFEIRVNWLTGEVEIVPRSTI